MQTPGDVYKGNGRVRHENVGVSVGPLFKGLILSYQAQEPRVAIADGGGRSAEFGGLHHCELYLMRNALLGSSVLERLSFHHGKATKPSGDHHRHHQDRHHHDHGDGGPRADPQQSVWGHNEKAREQVFLRFLAAASSRQVGVPSPAGTPSLDSTSIDNFEATSYLLSGVLRCLARAAQGLHPSITLPWPPRAPLPLPSPRPLHPRPCRPVVRVLAFDGPNRCGKGTQTSSLQEALSRHGIRSVVLRGDGSRPGDGSLRVGDPNSAWWVGMNRSIREPSTPPSQWHRCAYRLARELRLWRSRIFPSQLATLHADYGVLLLDRSLLSRAVVLLAQQPQHAHLTTLDSNDLYPPWASGGGRPISLSDVLPDVIFHLRVPADQLLQRLHFPPPAMASTDPLSRRVGTYDANKLEFRSRLILTTSHLYKEAPRALPPAVRRRVVEIDGTARPEQVFDEVWGHVGVRP